MGGISLLAPAHESQDQATAEGAGDSVTLLPPRLLSLGLRSAEPGWSVFVAGRRGHDCVSHGWDFTAENYNTTVLAECLVISVSIDQWATRQIWWHLFNGATLVSIHSSPPE